MSPKRIVRFFGLIQGIESGGSIRDGGLLDSALNALNVKIGLSGNTFPVGSQIIDNTMIKVPTFDDYAVTSWYDC